MTTALIDEMDGEQVGLVERIRDCGVDLQVHAGVETVVDDGGHVGALGFHSSLALDERSHADDLVLVERRGSMADVAPIDRGCLGLELLEHRADGNVGRDLALEGVPLGEEEALEGVVVCAVQKRELADIVGRLRLGHEVVVGEVERVGEALGRLRDREALGDGEGVRLDLRAAHELVHDV